MFHKPHTNLSPRVMFDRLVEQGDASAWRG
jgi:hypothetical protein